MLETFRIHKKPLRCGDCEYRTSHSDALKAHKVSVHKMEPEHECQLCRKKFSNGKLVRQHQTVHTGHRAYRCFELVEVF